MESPSSRHAILATTLAALLAAVGCAQGSLLDDQDAGGSDTGTLPDAGDEFVDTDDDSPDTDDDSPDTDDEECHPADAGETCNGRDDDCDGEADEEVTGECDRQQGVCEGATIACRDGDFPSCGAEQYGEHYESDETSCDGRDNDCDGEIDEGCDCDPGDTQECYTSDPDTRGQGICEPGEQTCEEDGAWGPCEGEVGPSTETCDGTDEDCDGEVDEGVTQMCNNQMGVCAGSAVACENGSFPSCGADQFGAEYESDETICDGLDNDCDGTVDEGLTRSCGQQQGVCQGAEQTCQGGSFPSCGGSEYGSEYEGTESSCDGLDNDCDGSIDEGLTRDCSKRQGVCDGASKSCSGGSYPTCGSSQYGSDYESGDETSCDGLDNDCDGSVDEGITEPCDNQTGVCDGATKSCSGGSFPSSCGSSEYGSDYESDETTCDGLDNDCDGTVDENNFDALFAGESHTCGLTDGGEAYCWGENADGQLGDGTTTDRSTPTEVDTTQTFETLALGASHTCGQTPSNGVYCWGSNEHAQIGDWFGSDNDATSPEPVGTQSDTPTYFDELTAADNHNHGLTPSDEPRGWGQDNHGQIGDGNTNQNVTADELDTSLAFESVSDGHNDFTCAARTNGILYCWGKDEHSQLANASGNGDQLSPSYATGLHDFVQVTVGGAFGCGRESNGDVYCWGQNEDDQLGVDSSSVGDRETPEQLSTSVSFDSIDAGGMDTILGGGFVCGLSGNDVYCWGENIDNQCGDGTSSTTDHTSPNEIALSKNYVGVTTGGAHACAWNDEGDAFCWGRNEDGQLGRGTTSQDESQPAKVECF